MLDATDGRGLAIHVRQSKTNPDGSQPDVRFVNGREAEALRTLRREVEGHCRAVRPVFGSLTGPTLSRRLGQAAEAAGIDKHITGHSGRVGLAVELTLRGASTHEVMLAGNWKSQEMVARYSAAAQAIRGTVARLMESRPRMNAEHPGHRQAIGLPCTACPGLAGSAR